IGEVPLDLQAKLLRMLDKGRVRPVGSSEEVETDVRLLFATNRNLAGLADEGRFRRDLLFRMGGFEVRVPPLRERVEDIPVLADQFRVEALGDGGSVLFDEGAIQTLAAYPWPGNIRELRNVVFRLVLTRGGRITAEDVKLHLGKPKGTGLFSSE